MCRPSSCWPRCCFCAYVPVGFMPAGGAPFRVELCPASGVLLPAQHAHHASRFGTRFAAPREFPRVSVRQCARSGTGFPPRCLGCSRRHPLPRGYPPGNPAARDSARRELTGALVTTRSRLVLPIRPTKRAWKRSLPRRARRSVWIFGREPCQSPPWALDGSVFPAMRLLVGEDASIRQDSRHAYWRFMRPMPVGSVASSMTRESFTDRASSSCAPVCYLRVAADCHDRFPGRVRLYLGADRRLCIERQSAGF